MFKSLFPKYESFAKKKQENNELKSLREENKEKYYGLLKNLLNENIDELEKSLSNLEKILTRSSKKNGISVEATYTLLSNFVILEKLKENKTPLSKTAFHKILAFDIIRVTSQLSDLFKHNNLSLNLILFEMKMEEHSLISEIRHQATHKNLPSLKIMKISLYYLIIFLFEQY